jgi:DNA uptake protein ComE-like DNA-binding protein
MSEFYEIETRPYLLYLNQIDVPEIGSELQNSDTKKIADGLAEHQVNFALPIACLTDEEDQYQLLTGLPIYQAAEAADVRKIWVFLIAAKPPEAEKALEQALLQLKHNQRVGETQDESADAKDFLEFINDAASDLTKISGIQEKTANKIAVKRPYTSLEDMQNKHGSKNPLKWLNAYQQMKS